MSRVDSSDRYCVIGAGPAGLTTCKNLLERDIALDCLESRTDLGGLWNLDAGPTAGYRSLSMITSKRLTAFVGHPMPAGLPPYPNQQQAIDYLRSYADRYRLTDHIEFNTNVESATPNSGGWEVSVSGEPAPRNYAGVIVASGHHWHPLWPEWADDFSGRIMHSIDYQQADVFKGQRVLIVGAGNTGCDLASEVSRYASATMLSLRRGYHFLPKFLMGAPIDRCGEGLANWRLPWFLYRLVAGCLLRIAVGVPTRYGLPKPDHRLFEVHPIINGRILEDLGHGRVRAVADVAELRDDHVRFVDGTDVQIDTIICATGYEAKFPFLPETAMADLYLNIFDRHRDDLFAVGLIQPNGSIWSLADYQAQLVAAFISAKRLGAPEAQQFNRRKRVGQLDSPITYKATSRHQFEVEYFSYKRALLKQLGNFVSRD